MRVDIVRDLNLIDTDNVAKKNFKENEHPEFTWSGSFDSGWRNQPGTDPTSRRNILVLKMLLYWVIGKTRLTRIIAK